jgi:hypothetical protein
VIAQYSLIAQNFSQLVPAQEKYDSQEARNAEPKFFPFLRIQGTRRLTEVLSALPNELTPPLHYLSTLAGLPAAQRGSGHIGELDQPVERGAGARRADEHHITGVTLLPAWGLVPERFLEELAHPRP